MSNSTTVATLNTSSNQKLDSTISSDVSATISSSIQVEVAYAIIGCIGVVGNFLVAFVLFSVPSLRKKLTNVFIINQSVIDLFVSIFLIATYNVDSNVPWDDFRGQLLCKFWQSKLFLWGFLVSSTYNLVALTVERWLEVVHPIWHKVSFSRNKATVGIVFIWIFGPAWNASYMIVSSIVIDGQCAIYSYWPSPTVRKMFGVITVTLQFLIPLCILVFCYGAIVLALHRRIKDDVLGIKQGKESNLARGRRNTIKTLALVALCFVLCWSWNQMYYLMMNLGFPEDYESNFYHFTVIAVFLNSCVNPIIYSLKYDPFKKAARGLFRKCMPRLGENKVTDTTMSTSHTATINHM